MSMMNSILKKNGWILLLMVCMGSVTSVSAQSRYQERGFQMQEDARQNRGDDSRRQQAGRQDARGERMQPRRNERLSPDERRTLRQQIDEAGRDIYAPRQR